MNQEERIIELETKLAFLENYINELNVVVIEQEKSIKKLAAQTEELKKQINSAKESLPDGEKPPHY